MTSTITLKVPIDLRTNGKGAYVEKLELRDMTAGDYLDASRLVPDNASRMELEMQIAANCSDVSMAVLRAMRPCDMAQISDWHDKQWASPKAADGEEGDEEDEDPSKAGATS